MTQEAIKNKKQEEKNYNDSLANLSEILNELNDATKPVNLR